MSVSYNEAQSIKIFISEKDGITRKNQPVRIGVPFPKGFLSPEENLSLSDEGGQQLDLQKQSLACWADGSVKWLLVDFFVNMAGNSQIIFRLTKNDILREIPDGLTLNQRENSIQVQTGNFTISINRQTDVFFSSIKTHATELLAQNGWTLRLIDGKGNRLSYEIMSWEVEEEGPLRATLKCVGKFHRKGTRKGINFTVRHTFFSESNFVQSDFTVHNPQAAVHPGGLWDLGDPGSFYFKELSVGCTCADFPEQIEWQREKNSGIEKSDDTQWLLYQDSSGGENWDSINHIDCNGGLTTRFCGYRTGAAEEDLHEESLGGLRATPWARMLSQNRWLGGAIDHFWQNFPKSLSVQKNRVIFGLFPGESGQIYELQGGEQKRHRLFINFGLASEETLLPALQHKLHAYVDPDWVEFSKAIPYFVPASKDGNSQYLSYVRNCIEGAHSFFAKREIIDEYGWRNFGDTYADHEAVNHSANRPFISHYNNQYDFIYGALVHFLRIGDNRWYELAEPAARHMIDIDIYHTDNDKPAYNHGLFWHTDHYNEAQTSSHRAYSRKNKSGPHYGGGTSNEHIYSSGLALYYYLTGERAAKLAVLELADYVLAIDDGKRTIFSFIDEGPTGLASQTVATDFHKPGRGAGNCINCLIDAYRLSKKRAYLDKAQELMRRTIHPRDDIGKLHLDDPEYRWSYLVFLQVLGKFLDLKEEIQEQDFFYFYARDSLLHYSSWMMSHEVPYQEVLHKVLIPTETWPAQDIRKCHVFHLASQYCMDDEREVYQEKAGYFFKRCLSDLMEYETRFLTRPLVLLAVYGYMHSFFEQAQKDKSYRTHCHDFGSPEEFIPQRQRLKKSGKSKVQETSRLLKLLFRSKFASKWGK